MIADQLKEITKTDHQQLEKLLVSKMKVIRSHQDYLNILQLFYSYFGGLEDQINKYINTHHLADYTLRRKTSALEHDINMLGGVTVDKAQENNLPQISNHLQAFGALYVIEGSTLGGSFISKMISQQLNLDQNQGGFSFFNGYGESTATMWESFKDVLNKQPADATEEYAICGAANNTFIKFKNWIENNG